MHQCYALWLGNAEVVLLKHALAWKDHVPTIVSEPLACTDYALGRGAVATGPSRRAASVVTDTPLVKTVAAELGTS